MSGPMSGPVSLLRAARFPLWMVWRESRFSWRRQLFFAACIALGVGGLVAVKSFGLGIEARMQGEARTLLAADLVLASAREFTAEEREALAELEARGARITISREFVSMASTRANDSTRLVNVRAVGSDYPFYGQVVTASGRPLRELLTDDTVLAHGAVLIHLGLAVGDTLYIGEKGFRIADELIREPDTVQFFGFAPRVLVTEAGGDATRLIREKSLVRYRAMVQLPPGSDALAAAEALEARLPDRFSRVRTYDKAQPRVSRFMGYLTNYLNLIGLVALILGGVGVAAAIRVFLAQKLDTIAVLKCLGATSGQVLSVYGLQAAALGVLGTVAGIGLGLAGQGVVPLLLADLVPVKMGFAVSWSAVAEGAVLGVVTTLLFTLPPILQVRHLPPARVFRWHVEPPSGRRLEFWWTVGLIFPLVFAVSVWEGGSWKLGSIFFGALAGSAVALYAAARGLLALLRRVPKPGRFVLTQGLSGLYRPGNQAAPVAIALGLGVLLVLLVFLLQTDLLRQIAANRKGDEPNLIFIDIQADQRDTFLATVQAHGVEGAELIPIVRGRIHSLNGKRLRASEIEDEERRRVLGFTYALTYRATLEEGEEVVEGRFGPRPEIPGHQVSVADWWTEYSHVGVGDTVTVDIQGVPITATVTSIRKIDWSNRRANFSLVFMPGALEQAPHMFVAPLYVPRVEARVALQKAMVAALPNVSAIDVELVLRALQEIVERIALVIQFMAGFSIAVGLVILGGAIATGKYQRLREAVLLKTLGATRAAVAGVLSTEYALLGALAGIVGACGAAALSWGLVTFVFDGRWDLRWPPYLVAVALAVVLTTGIGLFANLDILNRKPLQVLREE